MTTVDLAKTLKQKTLVPLIIKRGSRVLATRLTQPPIILGGCDRSGTTLLLAILAAHRQVFAVPGETRVFSLWQKCEDRQGSYTPTRLHSLYRSWAFRKLPSSADRWCEKTPHNVLYIERILDYFEERVSFIHIIRDARDVLTSVHPKNPRGYWVEPVGTWAYFVKAGLLFRNHPRVLTIRYEDLIFDFDQTVGKITQHCGLDEILLGNWSAETSIRQDKAWFGEVRDTHSRSVGKWKDPQHRDRLDEIMSNVECVALMNDLGYLPDNPHR